jgi:hypothetical protein
MKEGELIVNSISEINLPVELTIAKDPTKAQVKTTIAATPSLSARVAT